MAGEALAHVQASRLKVNAVVFWRLTNSPVTSSNVGGRSTATRGVAMKKLLILPVLIVGCVGPDTWNKEPWQREVFNCPAKELVYCVSEDQRGRPVAHEPGSDIYSLHGIAGGAVMSEISRADFRDIGKGRTEVSTYGVAYLFGPIPNHSLEVIESARKCEAAGKGAR